MSNLLKSNEFLENLIIGYFEDLRRWEDKNFGIDQPVRSKTWRINKHLESEGYTFSPARVRRACERLRSRGVLQDDPKYSASNCKSWKFR